MPDKVDLNNHTEVFKRRFDSWIYRLSNSASLPSDTDEQRLRKAVLILLAGICTTLGVFWGVAYLALGRPLAGSFPLAYSVISTASLVYFFRSKGYKFFCRGQLALILILPALLQWSLGGFAASGAVVIWSILAPTGALMFAGTGNGGTGKGASAGTAITFPGHGSPAESFTAEHSPSRWIGYCGHQYLLR